MHNWSAVSVASNVRIEHLAENPEVLPTLKKWFEAEWESYYGPNGPGDAQGDLSAYANRAGLPVGVIAFLGNELCGIAVLKAESITSHSHLCPWAAAALVRPDYRRKGIGTRLFYALEGLAKRLGYDRIYCGTNTAAKLLERHGWQFMEQGESSGERISIYEKAL
jgi:GNAT superfamily N-acetyltransferase